MKSKATSKAQNKRIDSKRARAAEAAALQGGHVKTIHGLSWGHTPSQPPLLDDVRVTQGQRKREKPVEYCPKREELGEHNKRHYYIEKKETVTSTTYDGSKYTRTYKYKECMYCRKATGRPWRYWRWLGL